MPPDPSQQARTQGLALALASAAAYGTNIVSAQIAGQAGLSGSLIVFYRVFVMLALVAIGVALWRLPLSVPRGQRGAILLLGLTSALVGVAYLSSVAFIPVSVAAVVFYTFPILIVLAEPLVRRTRFSPDRLAIALVAFAGVALVVGPGLEHLDPRGLILALVAAAAAATQVFVLAAGEHTSLSARLFWSHVIVLPVTGLILAIVGGFLPPQAFALAPIAVAVTIAGYLVGFLAQLLALTRIEPGAAGLAFCAEPVFAVVFAALVLAERLAGAQYAGGALVLLAIIANVILEQKRARRAVLQPDTVP